MEDVPEAVARRLSTIIGYDAKGVHCKLCNIPLSRRQGTLRTHLKSHHPGIVGKKKLGHFQRCCWKEVERLRMPACSPICIVQMGWCPACDRKYPVIGHRHIRSQQDRRHDEGNACPGEYQIEYFVTYSNESFQRLSGPDLDTCIKFPLDQRVATMIDSFSKRSGRDSRRSS